ncbi:MAG TPA: M56 family metallopeptidase [Thermoguttaceae bacterium]|nr:M56 family metallopeptidase [Thermoguttaceae bacterium]
MRSDFLLHVLGANSFAALASMSLWATVIPVVAWLVTAGLRRKSAAVRCCVWQLALTGLFVLPFIGAYLPGVSLGLGGNMANGWMSDNPAVGFPTRTGSMAETTLAEPTPRASGPADAKPTADGSTGMTTPVADSRRRREAGTWSVISAMSTTLKAVPWAPLLAGVWITGVAVHLVLVGRCLIRTRLLRCGAEPLENSHAARMIDAAASGLRIAHPVRVLVSARTRIPIALGVRHPAIVLPDDCERWPAERMRIVLAHELSHVQRNDVRWQLVARGVAAFYWFHPLVWMAVGRMKAESERACDDQVLRTGVTSRDYAVELLRAATELSGCRMSLLAGIRMAEPRPLESRLRAILDESLRREPVSRRARRTMVLGTACLVLTLGLFRPFGPVAAATAQAVDEGRSSPAPSKATGAVGAVRPERFARPTYSSYFLEKQSACWFHSGNRVHFVVYYAGFLVHGMKFSERTSGSPRWEFAGTLSLLDSKRRPVGPKQSLNITSENADTLILDGKSYDLKQGRVIVLDPEAEALQLSCAPLTPGKESVDRLGRMVAAELEYRGDQYTFPITVSGRATDNDGKAIAGATVYLSSQWADSRQLAKTRTDEQGQYAFRDVPLPIKRSDDNRGKDKGAFLIFGRAKGYGFAWRPKKWFHPQPHGDTYLGGEGADMPREYQVGEKIELDLKFPSPAAIHGRIIDEHGRPIAGACLMLWDCEPIRPEGYPTKKKFHQLWSEREFEILNGGVSTEMKTRMTDTDGRFVFTELPPDCRFRIDVRPPGFANRMVWAATCRPDHPGLEGYPIYVGDMNLTFTATRNARVLVLYGDTRKPAPKVFVELDHVKEGSSCNSSNTDGIATLRLPPGMCLVHLLQAKGTPYLPTKTTCEIPQQPAKEPIVVTLQPAAVVEVRVVDTDTGEGVPGVDLWTEKTYQPSSDSPGGTYCDVHEYRSWEVETNISHVERPRTNSDGVLRALFEPGKHRIGIAMRSFPEEYEVVGTDAKGREINAKVGKANRVVFFMRRRR